MKKLRVVDQGRAHAQRRYYRGWDAGYDMGTRLTRYQMTRKYRKALCRTMLEMILLGELLVIAAYWAGRWS